MSSAKSCPRVGAGVPRPGTGSQGWSSSASSSSGIGGLTRLSKAKSSPNVSKPTPALRTATRSDATQIGTMSRRAPTNGGVASRTSSNTGKTLRIVPTVRNSTGNVTIVQISRENEVSSSMTSAKSTNSGKIVANRSSSIPSSSSSSLLMKNETKKRLKDLSVSCTILEDRALLKKGLSCTPDRTMKKPEAGRNSKKCLSRSTSLWSVPVDTTDPGSANDAGTYGKRAYRQSTGSMEPKRDSRYDKSAVNVKSNLNRTTSLWNVQSDGANCSRMSRARSVSGLRPSKIPLFTQHHGSQTNLGLSLADLSSVDRYGEKCRPRIIDFDEVDKATSSNSRVPTLATLSSSDYKDTSEIIVTRRESVDTKILGTGPIYENLKSSKRFSSGVDISIAETDVPGREVSRTNSSNLETREKFDLEKRAAELMAQLDDDEDSTDEIMPIAETRIATRIDTNAKGLTIGKESRVNDSKILERGRSIAKSHESLHSRREPEISIQEIRRNWEKQIRRSQQVTESPEVKPKPNLTSRINSATVNLTKKSLSSEITNDPRKSMASVKRTKDIEHLVNFFNCKNNEPAKEIVDTWPKMKETTIIDGQVIVKKDKDKDEKSNGYASDGNCSEDSGHISNENEVEWKDDSHQELKSLQKGERFLKEIIHDLDSSLERTIEVFDTIPIVQRFVPEETSKKRTLKSSISTSSGASSIDSWEESSKSIKRTSARRFDDNAIPGPSPDIKRAPLEVTSEQIFFRSGALERLESQRDEKLTGHIILLQARCRGYLARRKLNTLKLQDLAVRCIQRNVRKLMSVREWPWWRLYVKVAPLLNVHRTEDQLKARTEELEVLRAKVERLEQERNHLKHDNDKLEAKVGPNFNTITKK